MDAAITCTLADRLARLRWDGPLSECLTLSVDPMADRVVLGLTLDGERSFCFSTWAVDAVAEAADVVAQILDSAGSMVVAEGIDADPVACLRGWP